MAKSIRSKIMKKHRAGMRKTVGEAQEQKNMRKALRRLKKVVVEKEAAASGAGTTLAGLHAALMGGAAAGSGSAAEPAAAGISVPVGPPRTKKLRHTFNTTLRETRVAADIEDLTDDEDDVRMGRLDAIAAASGLVVAPEAEMHGGDEDEDVVELSGVKKAPLRAQAKRGVLSAPAPVAAAAPIGYYDSDPIFKNSKRRRAHRKGAIKAKIEASAVGVPKR
jgi:hypothetical protein